VSLVGVAAAPAWPLLVACGLPLGLGAGAIDAGLNTYVAHHHGARTLHWIHACYGVGAAGGTAWMTAVLDAGQPWQGGYAGVAVAQLALAGLFALTLPYWPRAGAAGTEVAASGPAAPLATLRLPAAWLGIATFALYVGLEASIGVWAFSLLTGARGVPMALAGMAVSAYWAGLTLGRVAAGFVAHRVGPDRLLRACTLAAVLAASLIAADGPPALGLAGLALAGFVLAPVFPSLIAATPARLGPAHAANAIGFQVAGAVVGQSLVPWLVGAAAGSFGLAAIGPALVAAGAGLLLAHEAALAWHARSRVGRADAGAGAAGSRASGPV
jgi:fucose permease